MIRVKICCIANEDEARIAIGAGASAVGLVSAMPSGPGPIPEDRIARIAATVPPGVTTVLLTCIQDVEQIAAQQKRCGVTAIQICDRLLRGTHAELRSALPGIRIMQVIHVTGPEAIDEARRIERDVHAILLDSGRPDKTVKELGGTGRRHDWNVSREICQQVNVPVFLAGGLNPANVADAVRQVQPYGLDVCSGVRTDGHLDAAKVNEFLVAVRSVAAA